MLLTFSRNLIVGNYWYVLEWTHMQEALCTNYTGVGMASSWWIQDQRRACKSTNMHVVESEVPVPNRGEKCFSAGTRLLSRVEEH